MEYSRNAWKRREYDEALYWMRRGHWHYIRITRMTAVNIFNVTPFLPSTRIQWTEWWHKRATGPSTTDRYTTDGQALKKLAFNIPNPCRFLKSETNEGKKNWVSAIRTHICVNVLTDRYLYIHTPEHSFGGHVTRRL